MRAFGLRRACSVVSLTSLPWRPELSWHATESMPARICTLLCFVFGGGKGAHVVISEHIMHRSLASHASGIPTSTRQKLPSRRGFRRVVSCRVPCWASFAPCACRKLCVETFGGGRELLGAVVGTAKLWTSIRMTIAAGARLPPPPMLS